MTAVSNFNAQNFYVTHFQFLTLYS